MSQGPSDPSARDGRRRRARVAIRLAAVAVAAAAAAWLARGLRIDQDLARLLPDASDRLGDSLSALSAVLDRMIIDVSTPPGSPLDAGRLGEAADRLADRLRATGELREVQSSLDPALFLSLVELLRERAARIVDPARLESLEDRLRPAAVQETIESLVRRLQEPDGAASAERIARDPLDISAEALSPLARLGAGFRDMAIADGRITSRDGRHVLIIARPAFPPTDTVRSERLLESLDDAIREQKEDPAFTDLVVRHVGSHRATLDNARQIERDAGRTAIIGIGLIAAMVVATLARVWLALFALLPPLFGVLVAAGIFACFRESVPALVIGFGAVLAGLTVDYAIHFLVRIDRGGEALGLPRHPLLVSATTTIAALAALSFASVPAVRDVGLFGALGIAGAAAFTLIALPVLVRCPAPARAPLWRPERLLGRLRSGRAGRIARATGLLLTAGLAAGVGRIELEGDVQKLSSLSPAARADEEAVTGAWGAVFQQSMVVVKGSSEEEVLRLNEHLADLLERLRREGVIEDHASLAGLLPSLERQEERLRAWREFWSAERRRELREALEKAARKTPFRSGAFDPFLDWLQEPPPAWTARDLRERGLGALLEERLTRRDGFWLASTPVFTSGWPSVELLRDRLRAELPGALLINRQALVQEIAGLVRGEIWKLGAVAFAAVAVIVFAWHGRVVLAAMILLPLLLSLVWVLGILGWLGIPINFSSAVFVAFLFGAAVDYSIFLVASRLDRFRRGRDTAAEADASVFLCAATTGAGFGVLVLASHPVLFSIGATGLAGIASCLVVTALYVPPLAGRLLLSPGTNGAPGVRNLATAAWVLAVTVGRAAWFLVVERWLVRPERRERAALAALRSIARAFRFHLPIGRQIYSGREPIGDEGPFVIVSNHESIYDSFAALSLPIPVHILVKGWVWKTPLVRRMIRAAGFIPSDDLEFEEILQRARESMARGISVLVFPEGTRGDGLRLRRFHRGAFTIARRLGARVLPIAVANSGTMSRRGGFWVNHHEVRVEILDPLDPQDFAFAGEDGDRLMAREARRRILETRERLRREASDGAEWLRVIAGMYRYQGPVIGYYAASKVKRDPLVLALPSLSREDGEGGDGDADRGGPAGADACVQDRVSAGEDERERNGAGEGERKRRGSGEDERKRRGSGEDERERRGSGEDERERRRGGDVLVAGCGYGILTARLALAFPRRQILAVDADECKIEVARAVLSECPGARLEAGDVREVDIGEPRLALLVDVLHYWPEEAQRSIVERLAAAMPQGARLIFRDGCRDAGRSHRWVHAGERLAGRIGFTRFEGGLHFRSEAEWAGLLQECGFAIEERRPDLGLLSNLVLVARRERGRDAAPADGRDAAR